MFFELFQACKKLNEIIYLFFSFYSLQKTESVFFELKKHEFIFPEA